MCKSDYATNIDIFCYDDFRQNATGLLKDFLIGQNNISLSSAKIEILYNISITNFYDIEMQRLIKQFIKKYKKIYI